MRSNNLGMGVPGAPRALWVNGTDVRLKSGSATNRYGVPIDTVTVTEAGPPGVSSMQFTLEDPSKEITLNIADPVQFYDLTNDRPLFTGWVQSWTATVFGLGRSYAVECIGAEAVLEWQIVPSLTIPSGTKIHDAFQAAYGVAQGIGVPLRAIHAETQNGTQAAPIGNISLGGDDLNAPSTRWAITVAGESLREVLRKIIEAAPNTNFVNPDLVRPSLYGATTVDFYFGLRLYFSQSAPSDYASMTVTDSPAAALVPANMQQAIDSSDVVRQVYVKGGNAAGTGVVTDGSGVPGPTAYISDDNILTSADRDSAGLAYLADKSLSGRGSFELNGNTISTNVHPASQLTLTDAETGATGTYPIAQIVKRFYATRQDWTISFGGLPASFARALRRLTRSTRG